MKDKLKLYIDSIIDYIILGIISICIYGLVYSFKHYKVYTIIGLVIIGVIIYILEMVRLIAFRFDNLFKRINYRFWDAMMRLNQIFNLALIRYSLAAAALFFLLKGIYYMLILL